MKRILIAMLVAVSAAPAAAQTAAAIGKPLPSPDLEQGTVSVRVIAGSPSSPVSNTEVTLSVNGTPQVARTDDAGRAFFKNLPAGAQLQAKVLDEDKKEITSDPFTLGDSGVRLMLTTRPWNPGAGMGMGGPGGAMPEPRQMSGEPRPEDKDPPGTLTVRLTYDDFKDAPPVDVPVALVGYKADDSVTYQVAKSDKEGRATFTKLDRSGATAYFAMTLLPRGTGVDRLASTPAVLDARVGVRMILSGDKRNSTAPNIDDLTRLEKQENPPPAGKVRVNLLGGVENAEVRLVDAETKNVIGRTKPQQGPPNPQDISGQERFDGKPDMPTGTLDVVVHGGGGRDDKPMPDITVKVLPAAEDTPPYAESQTADDGKAHFATLPKAGQLVVQLSINGKPITTKPFELAKSGGVVDVEVHWDTEGQPEALFDLIPRPGQVVYAETTMGGHLYRSAPLQPVTDRGSNTTLFIYPRILFTFSLTSRIDDEYLAVNGRFELSNYSWAPYVGGPDGLLVPLPKGFVGGLVAEKDQGDVALEPTEGFRIVRPIAPGTRAFVGAFSLPVDGGSVRWNWDLPFGAFNSGIEFMKVPGMNVVTPPGVQGQEMTVPQGTFYVLPRVQIMPRQSMVMTITGLPSKPAWAVWLPRIIGAFVIVLILGGVAFAFVARKPDTAGRAARRQQLLDALVAMDKAGSKNEKRREELLGELESLWDD